MRDAWSHAAHTKLFPLQSVNSFHEVKVTYFDLFQTVGGIEPNPCRLAKVAILFEDSSYFAPRPVCEEI